MSIASYRMATSPTDQNNQNVIAFLDRLQASVQNAGTNTGANAFKMDTRADDRGDDSDDDGEDGGANELTERGSAGPVNDDDEPLKDAEDKPHALPDQTVPIGLLAKMALDNKRKPRKSGAKPKENESSDDDVVRSLVASYMTVRGVLTRLIRVLRTRRSSSQVSLHACFGAKLSDPDEFIPWIGPAYNLGLRATMIESVSPPEILVHGLVTPDDVDKLFNM